MASAFIWSFSIPLITWVGWIYTSVIPSSAIWQRASLTVGILSIVFFLILAMIILLVQAR